MFKEQSYTWFYITIAFLMTSQTQTAPLFRETKKIDAVYLFDIDGVIIEGEKASLAGAIISYVALKAPHKLSLMKFGATTAWAKITRAKQTPRALTKETDFEPDGTSYAITSYLKAIPYAQDYFLPISQIVNSKRRYISPMKALLQSLGNKGNILLVAVTNKDHYAFNQTSDTLNLGNLFHIVITADKKHKDQEFFTIPDESSADDIPKMLMGKTLYFHSDQRKPSAAYFQRSFDVITLVSNTNKLTFAPNVPVLFIDDTFENVTAFNNFKASPPFENKQSILFNKSLKGLENFQNLIAKTTPNPEFKKELDLKKRYNQWGGSLLKLWDRIINYWKKKPQAA